jgi:hypothetical protein
MMDTFNRFLNTKQEQNKSLSDYYNRFKQECDTINSLFETKIFDAASEKLSEYTSAASTTEQDIIEKGSFDAFASVVLLRYSDQDNYGTLLDTMTTTLALGTNIFQNKRESARRAVNL